MEGAPLGGSYEDSDVPAAVVCAACGRSDCPGCVVEERVLLRNGTPWEQHGGAPLRRLWRTALMTTVEGETFFGELGEGSVAAAFRFALLCELCAIASLAAVWIPLSYALVPG